MDKIETWRRELRRVLDSPEFQSSRQLREFLAYAGEAAFEGRTHIDQTEIAERVLHRGKDFDPVYDPAVRKMATLIRQRLENYYASGGREDPIVISLPMRSYVPQFRERPEPPLVVQPEEPRVPAAAVPVETPQPRLRFWPLAFVAGAVVLLLAAAVAYVNLDASAPSGVFHLTSVRGDIMHETNDLAGSAIQLGPKIGHVDQVTVRMSFTPEWATQQAGLLIFENADRYVKLGRQFLSRTQMEFGMETRAHYEKPPNTFAYDPDGQNGEPIWLSIRRVLDEFSAFVSTDGRTWRRFGNTLKMPDPMPNARVGIFAHNGRSDAPPGEVRFDRLTIGPAFYDWTAPVLSELPGWHVSTTCETPVIEPPALVFPFGANPEGCSTDLLRPVPSGDWTFSTRLDFTGSGTAAGLMCRGSKGRFRIIRWDVNGGSVTAEHLGHNQVNHPDFAGHPPLTLRFTCTKGSIQGSFSRDDVHFEAIPLRVPMEALGDNVRIGLHCGRGTWGGQSPPPPPRFFYFHQEIRQLSNYQ